MVINHNVAQFIKAMFYISKEDRILQIRSIYVEYYLMTLNVYKQDNELTIIIIRYFDTFKCLLFILITSLPLLHPADVQT